MDNPGSVLLNKTKQVNEIQTIQKEENEQVFENKSLLLNQQNIEMNKEATSDLDTISIQKHDEVAATSAQMATMENLKFYERDDGSDSELMATVKNYINELERILKSNKPETRVEDAEKTFFRAISACRYYCRHRHPFTRRGKQRKKDVADALNDLCRDYAKFREVKENIGNYSPEELKNARLRELMNKEVAQPIAEAKNVEENVSQKSEMYTENDKKIIKKRVADKLNEIFDSKESTQRLLYRCFREAGDARLYHVGEGSYLESINNFSKEEVENIKKSVFNQIINIYVRADNLHASDGGGFTQLDEILMDMSIWEKVIGVTVAQYAYNWSKANKAAYPIHIKRSTEQLAFETAGKEEIYGKYKMISENNFLNLSNEMLDMQVISKLGKVNGWNSRVYSVHKGLNSLKSVIAKINEISALSKTAMKDGLSPDQRVRMNKVAEELQKEINQNKKTMKFVGYDLGLGKEGFNQLADSFNEKNYYLDYAHKMTGY